MERTQDLPTPTTRLHLLERIETLRDAVQTLRDRVEHLETERTELLEENRVLRRRLTHSQLVDDLLMTLEEEGGSITTMPDRPPSTERLYRVLPSSFSFPAFFQVAEEEGLDTGAARRCLRHFLARDRLVQEGTQLSKREQDSEVPRE